MLDTSMDARVAVLMRRPGLDAGLSDGGLTIEIPDCRITVCG
ncbi:hypothetical protein [Actinoplanes couchii]|nr:hypothetical protein [Actinoplanes couchii]MDR6319462.1 hypothetical protein [Actinoplanes couchii]